MVDFPRADGTSGPTAGSMACRRLNDNDEWRDLEQGAGRARPMVRRHLAGTSENSPLKHAPCPLSGRRPRCEVWDHHVTPMRRSRKGAQGRMRAKDKSPPTHRGVIDWRNPSSSVRRALRTTSDCDRNRGHQELYRNSNRLPLPLPLLRSVDRRVDCWCRLVSQNGAEAAVAGPPSAAPSDSRGQAERALGDDLRRDSNASER